MRLARIACTISVLVAPLYAQTHNWVRSPLNGHLYALTASRAGWVALEAEAVAAGGHLATVRSQAELDWMIAQFRNPPHGGFYIGLTDQRTEGRWEWSSGEPVVFTNWCPGEPNNLGNEDHACVECLQLGNAWNDTSAADRAGVIEVIPSPNASYSTYRQSCPSSVGTPLLNATRPVVGQLWTITVTGLRGQIGTQPPAIGYMIFALQDQTLGLTRLPLDLSIIGAPGCFLSVNSDPGSGATVHLMPADPSGQAVAAVPVPNVPAVLGFTFYNQYVSLDAPSGRPLQITTTNAGRGVVGF